MWFKQAQIFQLSKPISSDIAALEEQLESLVFRPCLPSIPSSHGWVSPIDKENAPLVHAANGYLLICMQLEEKVLPAIVVRQALNEKIKELVAEQNRKISQKEKYALKDEIIQTLLPRAFSKMSRIYGYIDTRNHWLVIDTITSSKVEKFLALLKQLSGEISYHAIETKKIGPLLTQWLLRDNYPASLSIEKSCVLRDPNEQSRIIRCQQQDLLAGSIQSLLKDGCEVHQLYLTWQDKISFTLVDDLTFKNIKYNDEILSLAKDSYSESPEQEFDANFYIMTEALTALWVELIALFQGTKSDTNQNEGTQDRETIAA